MRRLIQLLGAVLVLAVLAPAQPRKGMPGPGRRQLAPHIMLDRLSEMSPEQRQRALERLPAPRRRMVEQRLERYNRMPPEERERLKDQYDIFQQLTPENRDAVRRMFRRFSRFPDERRAAMRMELNELRQLDEQERRARIETDDFRSRFSRPEQRLLENLSRILPAPD